MIEGCAEQHSCDNEKLLSQLLAGWNGRLCRHHVYVEISSTLSSSLVLVAITAFTVTPKIWLMTAIAKHKPSPSRRRRRETRHQKKTVSSLLHAKNAKSHNCQGNDFGVESNGLGCNRKPTNHNTAELYFHWFTKIRSGNIFLVHQL